jgi:hypothetical protein
LKYMAMPTMSILKTPIKITTNKKASDEGEVHNGMVGILILIRLEVFSHF